MTSPNEGVVSAEYLKSRFAQHQAIFSPPTTSQSVESDAIQAHHAPMNELTREEAKARIEASEARVGSMMEAMRADAAELRSELREGIAQIRTQGEISQANADRFYAEARGMLAESKTILAEIRLAGEQNKVNVMGMGYKFLTWFFGAIVAIGGLYFTVRKAVMSPPPIMSPQSGPTTPTPPLPAQPKQP